MPPRRKAAPKVPAWPEAATGKENIPDTLRGMLVPCGDLRHFHKNPRRGDVDLIRMSLSNNGQYRPIVVNRGTLTGRKNEVLAGNHTYAAAKAEGWGVVAATFVDVDDSAAARIVVVDNRANDKAKNDDVELAQLLGSLDGLEGTGYTDEELLKLLGVDEGEAEQEILPDPVWGVIVECDDEGAQVELLERLQGEGWNVRALLA